MAVVRATNGGSANAERTPSRARSARRCTSPCVRDIAEAQMMRGQKPTRNVRNNTWDDPVVNVAVDVIRSFHQRRLVEFR